MRRADVEASRDMAARYVKACDDLLALSFMSYDSDADRRVQMSWIETWHIAGKASGAHRRLSLDLTRALAHMRRRT